MNTRDNLNQQKFRDAGEQAGRVISEFMSFADDFSRRFEKDPSAQDRSFNDRTSSSRASNNRASDNRYSDQNEPVNADFDDDAQTNDQNSDQRNSASQNDDLHSSAWANAEWPNEDWQKAGEFLQELREAAGHTVDGIASALNKKDDARSERSVEERYELFPVDWPKDWVDQVSALLKKNDPSEFFNTLDRLYKPERQSEASSGKPENHTASAGSAVDQRKRKLERVFSDDQLKELTDEQFEKLLAFVETNYHAGLKLVRNG